MALTEDIPETRLYDRERLRDKVVKATKSSIPKTIPELLQEKGPLRIIDVSKALEKKYTTTYYNLKDLVKAGEIERKGKLYYIPEQENKDHETQKDEKEPEPLSENTIKCEFKSICKYSESSKCIPEICKYYKEENND